MMVPQAERARFEALLTAQAGRFGLSSEDYLRKIWYHEEAVRLGEYVAGILVDQLIGLVQSLREVPKRSSG